MLTFVRIVVIVPLFGTGALSEPTVYRPPGRVCEFRGYDPTGEPLDPCVDPDAVVSDATTVSAAEVLSSSRDKPPPAWLDAELERTASLGYAPGSTEDLENSANRVVLEYHRSLYNVHADHARSRFLAAIPMRGYHVIKLKAQATKDAAALAAGIHPNARPADERGLIEVDQQSGDVVLLTNETFPGDQNRRGDSDDDCTLLLWKDSYYPAIELNVCDELFPNRSREDAGASASNYTSDNDDVVYHSDDPVNPDPWQRPYAKLLNKIRLALNLPARMPWQNSLTLFTPQGEEVFNSTSTVKDALTLNERRPFWPEAAMTIFVVRDTELFLIETGRWQWPAVRVGFLNTVWDMEKLTDSFHVPGMFGFNLMSCGEHFKSSGGADHKHLHLDEDVIHLVVC